MQVVFLDRLLSFNTASVFLTTLMEAVMNTRLLTTKEAATFLCVSEAFLERDRWAGARIPFIKVGSRAVRYELSVLQAYIDGQRRCSTSEGAQL